MKAKLVTMVVIDFENIGCDMHLTLPVHGACATSKQRSPVTVERVC